MWRTRFARPGVGDGDVVAAARLCFREGRRGGRHQLRDAAGVEREIRDADADRYGQAFRSRDIKVARLEPTSDPLARPREISGHCSRRDRHEFVRAEARQDCPSLGVWAKCIRDARQRLIPYGRSVDVIEEAKIVDVHECHTNRTPVETRHLDHVGQRGDRGTVIQ